MSAENYLKSKAFNYRPSPFLPFPSPKFMVLVDEER